MKKPVIIDGKSTTLSKIKSKYKVTKVIDAYKEQLEDLFLIRNPKYRFNKDYKTDFQKFLKEHTNGKSLEHSGNWVYFPWNGCLVHYLDDKSHQEIRTARNKNVITKEEQDKFYNFSVGVAGLSVGSHGALTIALMGGAKKIKLADPDIVSGTNLNRMRFDFTQIGVNKTELLAQYIYQLNPYAEVHLYTEGISEDNMEKFLDGLDILVEELDDIEIKYNIRKAARKRKIPVVMATDNGDNVIIDIERFDLHPKLPIFHGRLDGFNIKEVKTSPAKMYEAMARIIDIYLVPPRILHSVNEVGKTIYSWPQLATAATLSGSVLAYVVRRIATGDKVIEGKAELHLDAALDPDYKKNKPSRTKESKRFLKTIGLA